MLEPEQRELAAVESRLRQTLLTAENDQASLSMLRARIKNLSKSSELYAATGEQLNVFSDNCVREIYELGKLDEGNSKLYRMFAETLKELDNVRRICMEQMQKLLAAPLKRLSEQKTTKTFPKPVDEVKDELYVARDSYDAALRKYAVASGQQPSAKRARTEAELATAKVVFESINKDFRLQVGQLSSIIKLGLLEQLCMYMYVQHSSFVMGRSLLGAIEPLMRRQLVQIENVRSRGWERQMSVRFEAATGREKEGYLYVRTHKHVSTRWAIRWVTVADGVMSWFKKWKTLQPTDVVQLEQCSVRSSDATPLQFQLITARETLQMRALSQLELNDWVQTIENSISHALRRNLQSVAGRGHSLTRTAAQSIQQFQRLRSATDVVKASQQQQQRAAAAAAAAGGGGEVAPPYRYSAGPMRPPSLGESAAVLLSLYELSVHNCACADCGEADPDWASLNTGALVCIVCASIHRSLPSGFNKTKSLTFDSWEPEQLELLRMIGNKISNEFWEFQLASDAVQEEYAAERPTKVSSAEIKSNWIRLKYIHKRFIPPPPPDCSAVALAEPMFQAVITENPFLLITLKAFGGDVNAVSADDDQRSLVHYAVLTKNSIALELLIQSGAAADVRDANRQSPLHYAVVSNTQRCAYLLIKRGLSPHQHDASGMSPIDLAYRHRVRWAIELFGATASPSHLSLSSSPASSSDSLFDSRRPATNRRSNSNWLRARTDSNCSDAAPPPPQLLATSDDGLLTSDGEPVVPPASAKPLLRRRPTSPVTLTNFEASVLKHPQTWRVSVELPPLSPSPSSSVAQLASASSAAASPLSSSSPSLATGASHSPVPVQSPLSTSASALPVGLPPFSYSSSPPSASFIDSTTLPSPRTASFSSSPSSSSSSSSSSDTTTGGHEPGVPVVPLLDSEVDAPPAQHQQPDGDGDGDEAMAADSAKEPPAKPERPYSTTRTDSAGRPLFQRVRGALHLEKSAAETGEVKTTKRDRRTKELRKLANKYNMNLPVGIRPSNVLEVAAAAAAHGEIPMFSSSAADLLDFVNSGDDLWDGQTIGIFDALSQEHADESDSPSNPESPTLPPAKPLRSFLDSIPKTTTEAASSEQPRSRPPLLRELSAVFEEIAL